MFGLAGRIERQLRRRQCPARYFPSAPIPNEPRVLVKFNVGILLRLQKAKLLVAQ